MTASPDDLTRKTPVPGVAYGPYQIVEAIGAGGMGEVYRARDSKLNRDVALKFLPEELSSDEALLARFEREAKLLALVNHPNIATIHSIEDADGHPFLVLELVDGEDLAQVLKKGPLPLDEALKVGRDIAAALEAAHRKGIVHRDLKPGNVVVSQEGVVKVLDFGIAKALQYGQAAVDLAQDTPSSELTATGTLLGTGPYMSPEQVRGKSAGKRADIWAFGCVMYQLLTGKTAFGRETLADTLTAILEREPNWDLLPDKTPDSIRRLLERCLRKDPTQRLQHIGDARIEIDEAIRTPSAAPVAGRDAAAAFPWWQLVAGSVTILVLGIVAGIVVSSWFGPGPPPELEDRSAILLPDNVSLGLGGAPGLAFSPDGLRLVVVGREGGKQQLYGRDANQFELTLIAGTEGAESPFFSPDGGEIGFFVDGDLRKVPSTGGEAVFICYAPSPYGGSWGNDGTIYFSSAEEIRMVSAGGGTSAKLTERDPVQGELSHRWPQVLPGGAVLFTAWAGQGSAKTSVAILDSEGTVTRLFDNAGLARYASSGHLVFSRGDTLWAQAFDSGTLQATGSEAQVLDNVLTYADVAYFALAENGSMVYVPGGVLRLGWSLAWVDGQTAPEPLDVGSREEFSYPRVSPDGRSLLVTVSDEGISSIGVVDLDRAGTIEPVAPGELNSGPEWSPDGLEFAYWSYDAAGLFSIPMSSTGEPSRLTETESPFETQVPTSWSRDDLLLYTVISFDVDNERYIRDVWFVGVRDNSTPPTPFRDSPFQEYEAVFSPNGRWVAYVSDEIDDRSEVWVAPAPTHSDERPRMVTTEGCTEPAWSESGSILYVRCGERLMAVDITTEPRLGSDPPRPLFEGPYVLEADLAKRNYDFVPTSRRFLMVTDEPIIAATHLRRTLNWHQELRRRTQSGS